jgi:hypothetical protein
MSFLKHLGEYAAMRLIHPSQLDERNVIHEVRGNFHRFTSKLHNNSPLGIVWEAFDFVINTYTTIIIRGIQQAIANHVSDSARIILKFIVKNTNGLLTHTKQGLFYLVTASLLMRFLSPKPSNPPLPLSNQLTTTQVTLPQGYWVPMQFVPNQMNNHQPVPLLLG